MQPPSSVPQKGYDGLWNWESIQFPNGVFDPSQIPNIQISTQLTPYRYDSQAFHRTTNKK